MDNRVDTGTNMYIFNTTISRGSALTTPLSTLGGQGEICLCFPLICDKTQYSVLQGVGRVKEGVSERDLGLGTLKMSRILKQL